MSSIFITPEKITDIAWEGELQPSQAANMKSAYQNVPQVVVSLGKPEILPIEEALEIHTEQTWVAPKGNYRFFLVRLACTLHLASSSTVLLEAMQALSLHTKNLYTTDADDAYAYSLFPDRLSAESSVTHTVSIGPKLSFSKAKLEAGSIGRDFEYKQVFPVIQAYGVGEATPYWLFKPHASHPLAGSQLVYAVVAVAESKTVFGKVEMTAKVDTQFGPIRLGLPREATETTQFHLSK